MSVADNPCQACPDTCCALKGECGLRLSPEEYAAHFQARAQDLRVRVEHKVVIISTREGRVCPNLGSKGCRIYPERPIDCRLYPYQLLPVYETKNRVKILLYLQPDCVANQRFAFNEAEAIALVEQFGRNVYGDKKIVVQIFRDNFLAKLKNKSAVLLVKCFQQMGCPL